MTNSGNRKTMKKLMWIGLFVILAGAVATYLIFTQKFDDTLDQDSAYTVDAIDLIHEFQQNDSLANAKYTEQVITVNGRVSEKETVDSTINIKMIDTLTNAYIIFAFQQQHLAAAQGLKEGDSVSIKGSCSGGTYSEILETESISFKRSALNK